ncbi:TRAPP II complex, Trs120 domain-containing protein [Paramicrosporidium saccamoebae]|uniref:TRAPP II complex, Trs120 domain-containing protein n=1 Tax=Paramicrosporidium saccamoebae TaxID=1246581 RepID=A0A2H9TGM0_9FUNG|nr:TRAPP II complex, Trs120 domain-containing protein [Paramicrosporidium saccamoebae]
MSAWRGVLDALRIRVAIFPVGTISNEQFEQYLELLRANCSVACSSLKTGRTENKPRLVVRCFLFGDSPPDGISGTEVAIIPDGDLAQIKSNVSTLLQELTAAILLHFDSTSLSELEIIDSPRGLDAKLTNPARLRARTESRLAKLTGDMYLLSGAYQDAVSVLVSAAEDTKVNGDLVWHASSQEALQIALVLQSEATLAEKKDTVAILWIALPDKLREIAPLYQKSDMPLLAFDVHRTVANLLAFAGSPAEAAMSLCQGWAVHRQLNFSDKLYALTVIISRFDDLKMRRKRAFYLQALSSLMSANKEEAIALIVLQKTFMVYKVDLANASSDGWPDLRLSILQKAALLSDAHRDRRLLIEYNCALLGYSRQHLDNEEQVIVAKLLKSRFRLDRVSNRGSDSLPCLLPLLEEFRIDSTAPDLWREVDQTLTKKPATSETFIYNPSAKETRCEPLQVAVASHGTLVVTLIVSNPFSFPIDLIGLRLVSDTVELNSEEIALTLPAWTKSKKVAFMCSPLATGRLCISRAEACIFGVRMSLLPTTGPNIDIMVIPRQPVLKIQDQGAIRLSLIDGELDTISLSLWNYGTEPVQSVCVKVTHTWEKDASTTTTMDKILFSRRQEPVKLLDEAKSAIVPGKATVYSFQCTGILGWLESTISFIQESTVEDDSETRFCRRLDCMVQGTVYPGISVSRISALPYQFIPRIDSPAEEKENTAESNLQQLCGKFSTSNHFLDTEVDAAAMEDGYCLVVIDVVNSRSDNLGILITNGDTDPVEQSRVLRNSTKRLVVPMKRLDLPYSVIRKDPRISHSQLSALRGIGSSDEMIAHIDRSWYWTKKGLLEKLKVQWFCEPARTGYIDLSTTLMDPTIITFLRRRDITVAVQTDSKCPHIIREWPVQEFLQISIKVTCAEPSEEESYVVRALPSLHVADDEFGLDFEDIVCVDGCLQAVYKGASSFDHRFSLFTLSPCRVQLLVHIERLSDASIHSHSHPLKIDFIEKEVLEGETSYRENY